MTRRCSRSINCARTSPLGCLMLKPKVYGEKASPHVYKEQLFEESNIRKRKIQYLVIDRTDRIDRFFFEQQNVVIWK